MIQQEILVNLAEHSYSVYAGMEMLSDLGPVLERLGISGTIVIIADRHVAAIHLKAFEKTLRQSGYDTRSIIVPPGEQQKSLTRTEKIYGELLRAGVGRDATIVAFGGGVIGDLAGFVAATYKRGIRLIQVPTSLLAQVDSSVGGKVGVNHALGKNMIGAFYQPALVWADALYLDTLPQRELVCGLGEVVKYAVAFDKELFAFLEDTLESVLQLEPGAVSRVRARCLEIKSEIVAKDERESGIRALLNLGHTVGHGLEAAGKYRHLKHGEAVLFGIVAESFIARNLGTISNDIHQRIVELIARLPLKVRIQRLGTNNILRAVEADKKSIGKKNRFVVPAGIGKATILEGIDRTLIADSIDYLRAFSSSKNA